MVGAFEVGGGETSQIRQRFERPRERKEIEEDDG